MKHNSYEAFAYTYEDGKLSCYLLDKEANMHCEKDRQEIIDCVSGESGNTALILIDFTRG